MKLFYTEGAKLLSCSPDEIAFVDSATRGWTLALNSFPFKKGDRLLTCASDYGSNFVAYLQVWHLALFEFATVLFDSGINPRFGFYVLSAQRQAYEDCFRIWIEFCSVCPLWSLNYL